jgi:predicted transcriptional regulator
MQIFNLISIQNLTPNQFYLLYCIRENVQSIGLNLHQELRALLNDGFIHQDQTEKITITEKGFLLLSEVESYFKVQKKKTSTAVLGPDFTEKLLQYNEMFPKIKLPSGKLARAAERNLETNFKWFFENYKYSWEIVLKATAAYVDEYERRNWNFMRTSMYFIKKQEKDHSITSDLADYCAMIQSGGSVDTPNHFSDKVV